jgi:hypothetical protein
MSLQDSVQVHFLERMKEGLLMRVPLGVRVLGMGVGWLSLYVMYDRE